MRRTAYDTLAKALIVFAIFLIDYNAADAQAPVANFTGSPQSGCSPLIVTFQDLSSGAPTAWAWDFGNGNTSTLQHPTATYFTPGNYTIRLTVTNASGSNTLTRTQYITVYEPPTVAFSAVPQAGCFPLRVQFTDESTAGVGNTNVAWSWDFGNGNSSSQQHPLFTYTASGVYNVTLRVTNDKGCTRAISRPAYITVTDGVRAGFTNTTPTVCSAPANISFTNTSTGPGTIFYQWNFGDGSPISTLQDPVHTYTNNGSYTVTLIATSSAGCEDTFRTVVPIVIGGYTNSFTSPASVCINEPASFINTSNPIPVSASWNFGDATTASGINATHSYSTPGTYTVWLYNTFSSCIDSVSQTIQVNPRPVADFSAPVTSRCQPDLTVNFQDISTGNPVNWEWDFGDGSPISSSQNPSHTYTNYGNYNVRLIVTNSLGCTDTLFRTAFVRIQKAVMNVAGLPARGCIPYTISPVPVINSVDAITSYEWDFGDGSPASTLSNPSHTYTVQGTYSVRLIITTSTGCRDTLLLVNTVRVGDKPNADFSAAPTPVCAFQQVSFTDLSTSSATPPVDEWLWDFGDGGTSTVQNPVHNYSDTGYFHVQLIATNNGCADTVLKNNFIYVLPPVARFMITPDCNNRLSFSFTDQSIAPLTWEWDFGDGGTSTVQNPVHVFPGLGTFTVRLIVTNNTCADTITHDVNVVNEIPDLAADNRNVCKSAIVTLSALNISPANVTSYAWDFGDGYTTTSPTGFSSHLYTVAGTYTVSLVITDINGCTNTIVKNNFVRVNGPLANFNANNTAGCAGLTTTFNDLSTTDGVNSIVRWQWNFGDGNTQVFTAPPFQHIYATAGVFNVQLQVTDAAGCIDSITINSVVTATDPVPDFMSNDTLACPGSTVNFTNTSVAAPGFTSLWDFGDGNTSTLTSPSHIYTATGSYTVKLRIEDVYGCADSITKNLYIRVDVPVAGFTVSDSAGGCTPIQVQFTSTSTYAASVMWDFGTGQGTSTVLNPVHFYTTPGLYTVTLTVNGFGGCVATTTRTIEVYDTAGSRITYLPIGGCKPLTVTLSTNTVGQMDSYFWDFGDGNTTTTTTPSVTHVYSSYGNFLPKMIMEDPTGCLIPLEGRDTVFVIGAAAKFGYDQSLLCDAGQISFTDSTSFNDPITSFTWDFGDGGSSTLQHPFHQYTAPGNYSVSLAIETQNACRDTATILNAIKVIQRPVIDIVGNTVICVNAPLLHTGIFLQPDTSIVTWAWNFPNGNTSILQSPPSQVYTSAGNFDVMAIATNSSGCMDTMVQRILVNPLPQVTLPGQITIQAGFPVTIPATYSPNTVSWLWSPSTGLSCTNCATPIANPKFNTSYSVYFTDENNCSNTGNVEVIVVCKNGNLFIPNTFSPNGDGSNDVFYPRGTGLYSIKVLRIFNRWGEVVFENRNFLPNDPLAGWNGSFKGKKPQADVYVYQAEVFCDNGDIIKLNGNIALIL